VENATLGWHTWPTNKLLINRETWLHAGSMPTSHSLPRPATAWVSVEPRLPHLKSLHTQPPDAKIQLVLEHYHGAYGTSINTTGRVHWTLDLGTLSAFALHLLSP
jgi:hypothetical protein